MTLFWLLLSIFIPPNIIISEEFNTQQLDNQKNVELKKFY